MIENHVVLVSMPKSASVFVRTAIELSAGLERHSFGGPLPFLEIADVQAFHRFLDAPRAQGGQHMAPSAFNLAMLREGGIERITLLLRDPRDALVSWRHNLERDDIDRLGWHRMMLVADGQIPADYYRLSWEAKLDALIAHYMPRLLNWTEAWRRTTGFDIQIVRYEDMVADESGFVASILDFHGVDHETIRLPEIDRSQPLDTKTHFRRGVIGSWHDEATSAQKSALAAFY